MELYFAWKRYEMSAEEQKSFIVVNKGVDARAEDATNCHNMFLLQQGRQKRLFLKREFRVILNTNGFLKLSFLNNY